MPSFKEIINNYLLDVTDINDRRLLLEAIRIIDAKPIMSEQLLNTLNEILSSIKEKYELEIVQDFETLEFMVILVKGQPIIENNHNIKPLVEELKIISNIEPTTNVDQLALTLLDCCIRAEENEIILLEQLMNLIDNNWTLTPLSITDYKDVKVKSSHIIPNYQKVLINKNIHE